MATFKKVLGIYKLHQPCFWRAVCGQPPAKLLRRLRHRLVDAEHVAAVERRRRQRRERVELARVGLQRDWVILGAGHLSQTSAVFALRHGWKYQTLQKVSSIAPKEYFLSEEPHVGRYFVLFVLLAAEKRNNSIDFGIRVRVGFSPTPTPTSTPTPTAIDQTNRNLYCTDASTRLENVAVPQKWHFFHDFSSKL